MSQEQIDQFYEVVQKDTALQERLKTVNNLKLGLKLVIELAKEKGYIFTSSDLKEWIKAKSSVGSENAEEELSEETFNLVYCHTTDCVIPCECTICDCRRPCRPCQP
ncbi:MAG: Nif11-like leader peptide family natural product precursor [Cyanobacteria bacterium J06633_8]